MGTGIRILLFTSLFQVKTFFIENHLVYLRYFPYIGTIIARTWVNTRTSVTFGFFYVLYHNFEMRHYFNNLKEAFNS
jgi:hypothetical protein